MFFKYRLQAQNPYVRSSRKAAARRAQHRKSGTAQIEVQILEERVLLSATAAKPDYVPGRIIVGFEGNVAATTASAGKTSGVAAANTMVGSFGLSNGRVLYQTATANGVAGHVSMVWELAAGKDVYEVAAQLSKLQGIAYAEPDYIQYADGIEASSIPGESAFTGLWGMNNTGQTGGTTDADIDALEAWNLATGSSSVVVGIIDSGVDYNHPDLAANMWTNPGEVAGNGIDDDGNGYVDDVHGYDFANNDGNPFDDNDHGTHVAGTIGAVGNNDIGVAGVNWNVSIMALKFLNGAGSGATSDAVEAINYATMMRRDYGVNIVVTNNSWGGGGFSQALQNAVRASRDQNMIFVAAAGNEAADNDTTASYPSNINSENVIAVAATDHRDVLASFSNYGATTVDIAAPGVNIVSTTPNNTYSSFNGTSMATPHVTGVVALLWSVNPSASYQQIRDAVLDGADPVAGLNGKVATGGRLNAYNSLLLISPAAPEVQVLGNDLEIFDGDASADAADFTDFGTISIGGGTVSRTFTVQNVGASTLNLSDLTLPDGYTLTDGLSSTLAAGASDTFTVRLDAAVVGAKSGQISFTTNDASETTFNFAVLGVVNALNSPEVTVLGNGLVISSGDLTPRLLDDTDFGTVGQGGATASRTFTVRNDGDGTLNLSGLVAPTGFTITEGLSATLAAGASDTFTVRLDSTTLGAKTGQISFTSNDSSESTYSFNISGGVVPGGTDLDDQIFEAISVGAISSVKTVTGNTVQTGNDVDMFSFTVEAGQRIAIDLDRPSGTLDSYLRLFNASGIPLNVSDDGIGPGEVASRESYLQFVFAEAGTYYLGVSAYSNVSYDPLIGNGDTNPNNTGAYTLIFSPVAESAPLDVVVNGALAQGSELVLSYTIVGSDAAPFDFSFYQSSDAAFGGDTLLDTISITSAADLTIGAHTKTFTIGTAANQISLPGVGVTETDVDYHLLVVADPTNALAETDGDPIAEDNAALLTGVYRSSSNVVFIHGGLAGDSLAINTTGGVGIVLNGNTTTFTSAQVTSIRARTHAGNDTVTNTNTKTLRVFGGDGIDSLTGPNSVQSWTINGANSGTAGATTFVALESVIGGTANDTFNFQGSGSLSGTVNGGAGNNTLDYRTLGTNLTVNLTTGVASLTGGVSNIQNVVTGSGNDSITGDTQDNILHGGAGNDNINGGAGGNDVLVGSAGNDTLTAGPGRTILIGGVGTDSLTGGANQDLLIGGSTTHDNNGAALIALMAEWKRTDQTYAQRIAHLNGTVAGGANGSFRLTTSTVTNDNVADQLFGNGDLDWFWGTAAEVNLLEPNEVRS